MPSGRTHFLLAMVAAPVVGIVTAFAVGIELAVTSSIAVLLGDLLLSPDLDHCSGATSHRMWGILFWIWRPYQKLVAHRSWSHWPIAGTAGRLLYLSAVPAIVVSIYGEWTNVFWLLTFYRDHTIAALVGVEISALVHIAADRSF